MFSRGIILRDAEFSAVASGRNRKCRDRAGMLTGEAPANIIDSPRFAYRGIHMDPCRHFTV